jgi:hypothetical protein
MSRKEKYVFISLDAIPDFILIGQRFPKHTQHAHVWMICEQQLLFDRAILNRKFGQAETNVTNIRALNEEEAIVRLLCK